MTKEAAGAGELARPDQPGSIVKLLRVCLFRFGAVQKVSRRGVFVGRLAASLCMMRTFTAAEAVFVTENGDENVPCVAAKANRQLKIFARFKRDLEDTIVSFNFKELAFGNPLSSTTATEEKVNH